MYFRHNPFLTKSTLFFFLIMVCYNPAFAQQPQFVVSDLPTQISTNSVPVAYVSAEESEILLWDMQRRGYTVREGTLEQLAELEQIAVKKVAASNEENLSATKKDPGCNNVKENRSEDGGPVKSNTSKDCQSKKTSQGVSRPAANPPLESVPPPVSQQPQPTTTVQTNVGVYADLSYGGSGGRSGDTGKVFFIIAGIMVVAAFIVYAGKYIVDMSNGKDYKIWREVVFSSTFLDTGSGQHGDLFGVKMATGFVSSDLIQVALVGEVGKTELDLILNENTNPTPLLISGTYWLLGATARLHLSDKLVNASYLYMDFMGGSTSDSAADTIGMARLGASFGVNDYMRLGASLGAHYVGLDKDQGFTNDSDNYWVTFGVEMGVQF